MIIKKCDLKYFRNYENFSVDFDDGINFIIGNNGVGKTNILESISVVSNLRSFRDSTDEDMINWKSDFYHISCNVSDFSECSYEVGYSFLNGRKKRVLKIADSHISKAIDFYGNIVNVFFTPLDSHIINGNVSVRRRYIDSVISKTDKIYLELIMKYRKMNIEKNILLKNRKHGINSSNFNKTMEVWIDMISSVIVDIVDKRSNFINKYNTDLYESYNKISGKKDGPGIHYHSDFTNMKKETVFEVLISNLNNDIRYGFSTKGCHKDIYNILNYDKRVFKDVSSQGEIRSAAIALKISEMNYIESAKNKKAVVLVDDIFSELDVIRKKNMINLFNRGNQVIMTMANFDKMSFDELPDLNIIKIGK